MEGDSDEIDGAGRTLPHAGLIALQPGKNSKNSKVSRSALSARSKTLIDFITASYTGQRPGLHKSGPEFHSTPEVGCPWPKTASFQRIPQAGSLIADEPRVQACHCRRPFLLDVCRSPTALSSWCRSSGKSVSVSGKQRNLLLWVVLRWNAPTPSRPAGRLSLAQDEVLGRLVLNYQCPGRDPIRTQIADRIPRSSSSGDHEFLLEAPFAMALGSGVDVMRCHFLCAGLSALDPAGHANRYPPLVQPPHAVPAGTSSSNSEPTQDFVLG